MGWCIFLCIKANSSFLCKFFIHFYIFREEPKVWIAHLGVSGEPKVLVVCRQWVQCEAASGGDSLPLYIFILTSPLKH
jgi:hypothetical protein